MAAVTQKGESLIVGIGAYTYTGHIVEDVTVKSSAEVEKIKSEDNETTTRLISDPMKEITLSVIMKTGAGTDALVIGAAITINSVAYCIDSVEVKRTRSAAKATITASKEASMTYT